MLLTSIPSSLPDDLCYDNDEGSTVIVSPSMSVDESAQNNLSEVAECSSVKSLSSGKLRFCRNKPITTTNMCLCLNVMFYVPQNSHI